MKSGAVDPGSCKFEGRQPMLRRKTSRNAPVVNGADEVLNYAVEGDSVVKQVNLAAAYHGHISCTKSADLCKIDGSREGRGNLSCETDHIYSSCSEIKNRTHTTSTASTPSNTNINLTLENLNPRDILIAQLGMISHLQDDIQRKEKELSNHIRETAKLKLRLERREQRMCFLRNYPKSKNENAHDISAGRTCSNPSVPMTTAVSIPPNVNTPVLATRYIGRGSRTIPSRALKRRYMGPPKTLPTKPVILKNEAPTAALSAKTEPLDRLVEKQEMTESLPERREADGHALPDAKKVRKKRGRRPKSIKKADYLTTDKPYFLPDYRPQPSSLPSPEIDVPSWKLKPVTSFYQMEGTENINSPVFHRRHMKSENDERRRKRWDMQRLREQKASQKLKYKHCRNGDNSVQRRSQSFFPDPRHIEYIEVTEQLPVLAFGHLIPLFQPCEFSLPWQFEENVTPKLEHLSCKTPKRGRPSLSGPRIT